MKRAISIFLILVFCSAGAFSARAQETRFPSPQGFVNDFAGVLSPGARSELEGLSKLVEEKTTAEIVVVTVKTTSPLTIEQYAVELFQEWGVGKKGNDNGILMLVSVDDRKVRIEVGYGLEGAVTDLQSKIIIEDLMIPQFKKGDFSMGVAQGVVMLAKLVRDEYGVQLDLSEVKGVSPVPARRKASPLGGLLTFLFFMMIFGFRFGTLFFLMSGGGGYWSSGSSGSFGGGSGGFGGGMS
ncbi:MAG: TPM domain-containing protein, partial [Candidatus Omnitrophota bacterium]